MSPGEIEQTRLLANAIDRASTACFTIGFATPVAGYIFNIGNLSELLPGWRLAMGVIAWLIAAFTLHYVARLTIKEIDK